LNIADIGFAAVARAARALAFGGPVPLFASLELTLKCNGSCLFCGSRDAAGVAGRELSTAEFNAIIDDLAASGCVAVSLTGGEPLLRTDVEALACRARGHGMAVGLNTNGRLLERRRSILAYLSSITVSLDGVEETNDRIRGRGAYAAAVSAIRTARHGGVPVNVTTVLSEPAIADLDAFLQLAGDLDLEVMFQPQYGSMLRSHRAVVMDRPSPQAVDEAFAKIAASRARGLRVRNSDAGMRLLSDSFSGRPLSIRCPGGRLFVRVGADGSVGVCGLDNDPCARTEACDTAGSGLSMLSNLDARDGIRYAMRRIGWPFECGGCLSAARADLCAMAAFRDARGK